MVWEGFMEEEALTLGLNVWEGLFMVCKEGRDFQEENPAAQPQGNVKVQTGTQSWQRRERWAAVAL